MTDHLGRFTSDDVSESKNVKWRGDSVGYFGLHTWLKRRKGMATKCSDCGSESHTQWANISKKYKRDVGDWKPLCAVCHRRFDGITKLTKEQANQVKDMFRRGVMQKDIAKVFNVHYSTISNIIRGKIKYYA